MKKIIITGGLGYIGYELCKIYSGKSHNYNVTVIDNKFFSKRVNQLRNWNIEYINADILDKNLLKNIIQDADIVHHIMIVYLDGNGEENMGTVYYENNEKYLVTYEKNNGLILLNTSKVYHGMGGSVPDDVKYRKLFYINWMNYA